MLFCYVTRGCLSCLTFFKNNSLITMHRVKCAFRLFCQGSSQYEAKRGTCLKSFFSFSQSFFFPFNTLNTLKENLTMDIASVVIFSGYGPVCDLSTGVRMTTKFCMCKSSLQRFLKTLLKVRFNLYVIRISTTGKYCSVAFIVMVTLKDFIQSQNVLLVS